jgi:hypothetical protein
MEELFIERIKKSNIFSKKEIDFIINHIRLYKKCYILGLLDDTKK